MTDHPHTSRSPLDEVNEYSAWDISRRIMSYLRPYRARVAVALVLSLLSSVLLVLRPYLIKVAIDRYIVPGQLETFGRFMLIVAVVYLLRLFVGYFMNLLSGMIGQDVMHDLRMHIFSHILSMDMNFFDHTKVGRLMTRTTDDVASLNELYTSGAIRLLNNFSILVGIVVVMAVMDWRLTLVTLASAPLIYIAASVFARSVRIIYRNIRRSTARMNAFLQENILGVRIIKQMLRTGWSYTRFDELSQALMKYKIANVIQYGLFFPVMEFIGAIGIVLVLGYGGWRIQQGTLQLGVMFAFIRLVDMFFMPVREMAENFNVMLSAMASSERIFTLLDDRSLIVESSSPVEVDEHPVIEFEHVWFAYEGEDWVLRDVSFTVRPGEQIAIVGPTGSGKSTIINLLLRFYDVTRGSITLDGADIRDIPLERLRSLFAHVGQDPFLFNRSVCENITLDGSEANDVQIHDILRRIDAERVFANMEQGLDTIVRERGSRLSQGQKQVVSFVRAMSAGRQILILDEATSSVDTFTDDLIQRATHEMMEGRTSIVIAHRLSTVRTVDQIHVIARGRIRESGNHQELMAQDGIYAKLSRMHFG